MKNLIKIQAIINQIEEMSLEPKYRSEFIYKNETEMLIRTKFKSWTIAIMQILENIKGCSTNFKNNTEIMVLDYIERLEENH